MRRPFLNAAVLAISAAVCGLAAGQVSVVYQQSPANPALSGSFANLNSAYSTQRMADHFTLAANTAVTELSWWGFMYAPLTDTQVGLSNLSGFQVQVFRSDGADGVPGTLVYAETLPMDGSSINPVSSTVFGPGSFGGSTYEFHGTLTSPVALTAGQTYWLAINAVLMSGTSTSPLFAWMDQSASGGGTLSDGRMAVDGLLDPVDGVWVRVNGGPGGGRAFKVHGIAVLDADHDGLSDADELLHGTDPHNPDTDGDGLLDGTEVDLAATGSCLDPLNPDSDGDGLLDGEEVALGYNPCSVDTDGDGLDDFIDPQPLVSLISADQVALATRDVAEFVLGIDVSLFNAPNQNAAKARRNELANLFNNSAKSMEKGRKVAALVFLVDARLRVDGGARPKDWMIPSEERTDVLDYIDELIRVIQRM